MCFMDTARRVVHTSDRVVLLSRVVIQRGAWAALPKYIWSGIRLLFSAFPLPSADELSLWIALIYSSIWFLLLFPVPLSRIALKDHTPAQALMGGFLGFV